MRYQREKCVMNEKRAGQFIYIAYIPFLCLMALITVFSSSVSGAVLDSLIMCGKILIPSIFPYLVISGVLVKTGFAEFFGDVCGSIISHVTGFNKNASAAVVTGMICGFPSGAASACGIMKSGGISENEAKYLIPACSMASPGFTVFAVGVNMLGSFGRGVFLYFTQVAVSLAVGSLFYGKQRRKAVSEARCSMRESMGVLGAFTSSLSEAIGTMVSICGTVIFFSVIAGVAASAAFLPVAVKTVLASVLELSTGCAAICSILSGDAAFAAVSAAVGWTGLSVFAQTTAVGEKAVSGKIYIAEKLVCSLLCAVITYAAAKFGFV